jgi:hypothetical protein
MSFWADFWNALTGIGTLGLAGATFCVIRQGQRQRAETERQHQDRFKPICVLGTYSGVDAWTKRAGLLETIPPSADNPSYGTIKIRCVLQNVGVGPALNLRVKFRFLDMNGWTSEPWEISPLAAGESYGSESALFVPFPIHEQFNQTDFAMLIGKPWEIWLEYEDVFGRQFQSVHSKSLLNSDPATFTWTAPVPGQEPKAVMRPIPWFTYHEGPTP